MQIIQIVPRLPPAIDGVGDYSLLLAKQLRASHGIHTQFVICDPAWKNVETLKAENGNLKSEIGHQKLETELDGFRFQQLKKRTAKELLRVLSQPGMPPTVLLHYVGYGYQRRGCPVWLVEALREWKKGSQKSEVKNRKLAPVCDIPSPASPHLVTMFHELSASGPAWSSVFWMVCVQRWLAKSLARLSNYCLTNLRLHARVLQKFTLRNESDIAVLPVFSNVGEPEQLPDWNKRAPRMIVFGSENWRRKVYTEHKFDLEEACHAMGLDEIVDIGAAVEIPQLSVRVSKRGILPAVEASHVMLDARAGFFACPVNCMGKSGILAAYTAHGLAPVTFGENDMKNEDGLTLDKHYVSTNARQERDDGQLENIGKNAREWYQNHTIARQANFFAGLIRQEGASSLLKAASGF